MSDDGTMRLIDVTELDEEAAGAGDRRASAPAGPVLNVTISGVSGERVTVSIPRSEVEGRQPDAEALLMLAIERGQDDFDGTPEELGRRRSFLHGLPDQIAAAGGGANSRYLIMMEDSQLGTRQVHPRAPVRLGESPTQDLEVSFTVAPYHVGGRGRGQTAFAA